MSPHLRRTPVHLALLAALCLAGGPSWGQQVLIDRGIRANGLWCFPLITDSLTYVYLPDQASLALDEQKLPQFSFLRYVFDEPGTGGNPSATGAGAGGAVLHFLVLYETPPGKITGAQKQLRETLHNDAATLRGPLVFDEARYALISSILLGGKTPEQKLLAIGQAPVLEGSRVALSFEMDPRSSTLLLESFKMPTPDISLVFDLAFRGLTEAYNAQLTVNWSEVRKSSAFKAGGSVYFISAEVEKTLDDLRRNNAITLHTSGTDANSEALVNAVYGKLLDLLFRPVEPATVPKEQRGGLFDAIGALLSPKGGKSTGGILSRFNLHAGYQVKDLKSSGSSVLRFDSRLSSTRHHLVTFNIGNLYSRHGTDRRFFRTVALEDADFQQREVGISVDGSLAGEFAKMINSVTVTLRKVHQNGDQTIREQVVTRQNFSDSSGRFAFRYGSHGDADRLQWLGYEYRTTWQFQGGGVYSTRWTRDSASMINLFAPYSRQTVEIVGDPKSLAPQGVRAVVVQVDYPFFGDRKREQVTIQPGDTTGTKPFEVSLPLDQRRYDFKITWIKGGGERLVSAGTDSTGVLFIDEIPGK